MVPHLLPRSSGNYTLVVWAFHASNDWLRFVTSCSARLPRCDAATLASADFYTPCAGLMASLALRQTCRPQRIRRVTFLPHTRRIYVRRSG